MLNRYPHYFKEFRCIASECEATCCSGWQIVIDDESLDRYDKVEGSFRSELLNGIVKGEDVFQQQTNRDCYFLNGDNLCEIYKELGEESLCFTCKNYPRHIEEFEELNEVSLAISCPVVAKIILQLKEPVTFFENEEEWHGEPFEEFDFMFFDILLEVREVMNSIFQNREQSYKTRNDSAKKLIRRLQEKIEEDIFGIQEVLFEVLDEKLENSDRESDFGYKANKEGMMKLFEFEELQEGWQVGLQDSIEALYGLGAVEYSKKKEQFYAEQDLEVEKEQLMVYFLFTYLCGAVYDGNLWGKYNLADRSVCAIEELWFANWLRKGSLSEAKKCEIVYRYARELEHSDLNLELIEEF